ncbi:AVAST type 1 anti-phage system protein Avs1c [Wenyingzhuangia sp. 2_MG-2023]|uniref:AVAST type 1 anti-phage system protein Avs1c n=1 Tax=Wenyingzhuangia sp. 2_MG-2023 TaxID=3062639 RepID=UPI0026E37126|nr:AVAST type 1 anti-phage system protein Avs1c [Wenyingzhuangia sp. 2_MG-2023]MDO6737379.1 AVAST type 1 anti-phage system protein Avs1c [Wenyingzhuangia sp. 2_MG-2023]
MIESRKNYRDSRLEFERHLNLLAELMEQGKLTIAEGLRHSVDGITKVRYSPNKRIDLNTVNEMVRNMAMMASNQNDFKEHD